MNGKLGVGGRTDIGKYSIVNRTIQDWNQLPAEVLEILPCKLKTLKKRVRKAIIDVSLKKSVRKIIEKCSEVKWSEVKGSVVKCSVGKGWKRGVMGRIYMGGKVVKSQGLG